MSPSSRGLIRNPGASPVLRELGRVARVRPSLSAAARAAVATGLPLLAAHLLAEPGLVWAAMGGFTGALVDRGGGWRTRAINLAAVTAAVAVGGALATLVGHPAVVAAAAMLVWGAAASFLRVYGVVGANAGLTGSVTFAVSLAMPGGSAAALERGLWLLAGGAWAGFLALSVWPLRPYLPARLAIARCYRALGAFASRIAERSERRDEPGPAGRDFDEVRQALEAGWETLRPGRRGRGIRSAAAEQLVVLLETADQMLGTLVALSDVAERVPEGEPRAALTGTLRELDAYAGALAGSIERGIRDLPPPPCWKAHRLPGGGSAGGRSSLLHAEVLLRSLRELADWAGDVLEGAHRPSGSSAPDPLTGRPRAGAWLDPVRDNLSGESVLFRHALRMGVTAALAVALSRAFRLEHGYWVTLTVVFILQPYAGLTLVKGLQRVVGTVLGGVVAALIPMVVRDPVALLTLVACLAGASVVTLPINYALFALFVTPTFVLLAELQAGTWNLAGARVLNTVLGGLLAVAGARLLWSMPERRRFPAHAAAALRTAGAFLRAAAGPEPRSGRVPALRRELGLEIINLGESFQRLVIEEGADERVVEPERTMMLHLRRLTSAAVAFASTLAAPAPEAAAVQRFIAAVDRVLEDLAAAVAEQRPPPPLPPLEELAGCPARLQPELERIARPIRVLHGAAARAGARLASPPAPASR